MAKFRGSTRFEVELEFVQSLANPWYLNYLASQKFLDQEEFLNYLTYLQYWRQPEYTRFLQYPGPSLRALQLLQEPTFRQAVMSPDFIIHLIGQSLEAVSSFSPEDPISKQHKETLAITSSSTKNPTNGSQPTVSVITGQNSDADSQPRMGLGLEGQ